MSSTRLLFWGVAVAAAVVTSVSLGRVLFSAEDGSAHQVAQQPNVTTPLPHPVHAEPNPSGAEAVHQTTQKASPSWSASPQPSAEGYCAHVRKTFRPHFIEAMAQVGDVTDTPRLGQPWHFAKPSLCGAVLLYWLTGGEYLYSIALEGPTGWSTPTLLTATTTSSSKVHLLNCGMRDESLPRWNRTPPVKDWQKEWAWPPQSFPPDGDGCIDLAVTARLTNQAAIAAANITRSMTPVPCSYTITLGVPIPGDYNLEVKTTHINGNASDPTLPFSLGVVGIRGVLPGRTGKAAKTYYRNDECDRQRHTLGSPVKVVVTGPIPRIQSKLPRCGPSPPGDGYWVNHALLNPEHRDHFFLGNPSYLTDACGFNTNMVWVPHACRLAHWSAHHGPDQCVGRNIAVLGDSVAREYWYACKTMGGQLACSHWHYKVEGKYYTTAYAKKVVNVIIARLNKEKPDAVVTNLGMLHMIGTCTTEQWVELLAIFRKEWEAHPPPVKRAVWVGASRIHWAWKGMGPVRGKEWSAIAYRVLAPLGFEWMDADHLTQSREEATWDGTHYAAEEGKKQTIIRNRHARRYKWNGGVAVELLTVVVNMLCSNASVEDLSAVARK